MGTMVDAVRRAAPRRKAKEGVGKSCEAEDCSSEDTRVWCSWPLLFSVGLFCLGFRYLLLVLMDAERAWSYAMQLKQEANTEPRKRFHLLSRLRKAVKHAEELERLCESNRVDAKTKLEAQVSVITSALLYCGD